VAVGYESQVVNGQLVNVAPGQGFAPLTFGSMYTGPGMWPRNGAFNVPPVTPSPGTTGQGGTTATGLTNANGSPSPTLPTAGAATASGANFLHPTKSPVLWFIAILVFVLFMLHKVHFRG
jgi:hypothetical protein